MRRFMLALPLFLLALSCTARAQPPTEAGAEKISIPVTVEPRELRLYRAVVDTKGRMPVAGSSEPVNLDATFALKVQHKYGVRDTDGLLTLEISVTEGEMTSGGQKLAVSPNTFPKLTLLLDRDWQVQNIFGITNTRYEKSTPGLNYVNLILLFYPYGAQTPRAVGETWNSRLKMPVYQETYEFASTLKSVEETGGVKAATIAQSISWVPRKEASLPPSTAKAAVQSVFSIDNGKLVKSHADCEVVFASTAEGGQGQGANRASIKIDITLIE